MVKQMLTCPAAVQCLTLLNWTLWSKCIIYGSLNLPHLFRGQAMTYCISNTTQNTNGCKIFLREFDSHLGVGYLENQRSVIVMKVAEPSWHLVHAKDSLMIVQFRFSILMEISSLSTSLFEVQHQNLDLEYQNEEGKSSFQWVRDSAGVFDATQMIQSFALVSDVRLRGNRHRFRHTPEDQNCKSERESWRRIS